MFKKAICFLILLMGFGMQLFAQQPSRDDLQKKEQDIRKEWAELNNMLLQTQKSKKLSLNLNVEKIHLAVPTTNGVGQLLVTPDKSIQSLGHHGGSDDCHARQVNIRLEGGLVVEFPGPFGYITALITNPLQVGDNLQSQGDEPEIPGRRLTQRQNFQTALIYFNLQPIDLVIVINGPVGQVAIALHQRLHGVGDHLLNLTPHLQQAGADIAQIGIKL